MIIDIEVCVNCEDMVFGFINPLYNSSSLNMEFDLWNSHQVLDATDNEPWGPHGSALAEIAQATKKL